MARRGTPGEVLQIVNVNVSCVWTCCYCNCVECTKQIQRRQAKKILKCCTKTSTKSKHVNQQENDETEVQNSALITDVKSLRRTFSLDDSSSSPLRKIMETIPPKSPVEDEEDDYCDRESHFVDGKVSPKPEYSLVLYETAM